MTDRISTGEKIAGIAGLALILIMFLFAWYGVNVPGVHGFDAFDAFDDWVDMILVAAAFCGMALALFGNGMARIPVSFSVLTTVLGGISSIILVIYIISPPGVPTFGEAAVEVSLGRKIGVWLGLASAIALAVGGYKTMQEEGTSFADAADRLSSGRGHQPEAPPEHEPQQPDYQQQPPPPHDYQAQPPPPAPHDYQAAPPPPPPPPQGY